MKRIEKESFDKERSLYGKQDIEFVNCNFEGESDGESPLKECRQIRVYDCFFNLRYPLWHDNDVIIKTCIFSNNSRAAIWYTTNITITNSKLFGVKAIRECSNVSIYDSEIKSDEFAWKSNFVLMSNTSLESIHAFFMSNNISIEGMNFNGKYSFQYTKNGAIQNSKLVTKDAFRHSENLTIKNSIIDGEYTGWYSSNLTLVNCIIKGTQPFCYAKNLKLINCTMIDCDLAFEYSSVEANICARGTTSIKNPKDGFINCEGLVQEILTDDSKYKCNCNIKIENINFCKK